jgi:hypothetical protein
MIESNIKENLIALQSAIRSADGATIGRALSELDRLAGEGAKAIDPQLLHFLRNRSYEKALAFLGGDQNIPAGICGGGKR